MFNINKLGKMLPFAVRADIMRIAGRRRAEVYIQSIADECCKEGMDGSCPFINHINNDTTIYIVYGISKYAVVRNIIRDKQVIVVFPDYIIQFYRDKDLKGLYNVLSETILTINNWLNPSLTVTNDHDFICDIYHDNAIKKVALLCIYSVWKIFGTADAIAMVKAANIPGIDLDSIDDDMEDIDEMLTADDSED